MGQGPDILARYLIKTARISVIPEHLHIAGFCLDYLNFGCFHPNLTKSEIRSFLRQGYYSFEDYAIAHWLDHVASSTSQPLPLEAVPLDRLAQKLETFFIIHGLDSSPDISVPTDLKFQSIRHWDLTKKLDGLAHLARQRESSQKYLDLEAQLQRRRSIYEDIVTNPGPGNEALRRSLLLNASGWFKCPQTHCDSFFDGCLTKKDRDQHISRHERPFRCPLQECLYAKLGYATEKELERHKKKSHPIGQKSEWAFPTYKPQKELTILSAAEKGDLVAVKRFVEEGADVDQTTRPSGTISALRLAIRNGHSDIALYLLEKQGHPKYIEEVAMDAARYATSHLLQTVIEKESTSRTRINAAQLALNSAARSGREELIPLLLSYGIDGNEKDSWGCTALIHAKNAGHSSFVRALLKHGDMLEELDFSQFLKEETNPTPIEPVDGIEPERNDPELNDLSPYQSTPSPQSPTIGTSQSITSPHFPFDPQLSILEQSSRRHPSISHPWANSSQEDHSS